MLRFALLLILFTGITVTMPPQSVHGEAVDDQIKVDSQDWPWWRGPLRNGTANPDQQPPTKWSSDENVVWQSPVPGRGHGSPTVVGDCVYLATGDEKSGAQSVLCFDRKTGRQLWNTVVHDSGLMIKNSRGTGASSSVACDGQRLFINFANSGAMYTTALSLGGKQLWQTKITDYVIHQGYGSSPAIYQSLVIVSADNKGGGAMAGLDRKTGNIVWRNERPKKPNYSSPVIFNVAGKDQLFMTGCNLVSSFEPLTGKQIWQVAGATTECVTSTVTDGKHIYSSGGYPRNHMSAYLADGSGKIVWENKNRIYVPSILIRNGYLYGVMDAGVAGCWKCDTGEQMWKARLGGNFTASPVLVGERIYATNESGATFIFAANPERFRRPTVNQLGDEVFASATICGGKIFMRVANTKAGSRQETLYCLGDAK